VSDQDKLKRELELILAPFDLHDPAAKKIAARELVRYAKRLTLSRENAPAALAVAKEASSLDPENADAHALLRRLAAGPSKTATPTKSIPRPAAAPASPTEPAAERAASPAGERPATARAATPARSIPRPATSRVTTPGRATPRPATGRVRRPEKARDDSSSSAGSGLSNVRVRRLKADYERLLASVDGKKKIRLIKTAGNPPEKYQLEYLVRSLIQDEGGSVRTRSTHLVEITLTRAYPRQAPQCRMLTPIFHPNVAPHAICVGDHWAAGETLGSLVTRIGEMLAFQSYNLKSPLNGEAARWVAENESKLPLDDFDFSELLESGDGTVASLDAEHKGSDAADSCANCGKQLPRASLSVCEARHLACKDCLIACASCARVVCLRCRTEPCGECKGLACIACLGLCPTCKKPTCAKHRGTCLVCKAEHCSDCTVACVGCGGTVCVEDIVTIKGKGQLCTKCGRPAPSAAS
jgi:ubiquitin-protein ligase